MAVIKCKMCGGTLDVVQGSSIAECEYCGSLQTLPKASDERLTSFYERANDLRMSHEFDKAAEIYERIIAETPADADAYWSMVLCRYGIEYVEETRGSGRKPTINRAQLTSVTEDVNYRSALKYADPEQKRIYEAEAARIDQILQRYLEISRNEPPYDVFICYKETDAEGRRTIDSVRAGEIYRELTTEGFKVFFAPVTLENKLGEDYEPYIFAAINSAKVMVVIGTRPEYMNAVWVKNEWSRFLTLAKEDSKKTLIPVYGGMDPYDMPEAFRFKQSQNMEKLGFMLDLVRGIEKLVGKNTGVPMTQSAQQSELQVPAASVDTLLQRAAIFLEDQDWRNANIYCEKVLDIAPTNGQAYLYKLLAEAKVTSESALVSATVAPEKLRAYKNAVRYADEVTTAKLIDCNQKVKDRLAREEETRLEQERIRLEQEQLEIQRQKERIRRQEEYRQKKKALTDARENTSDLLANQVRDKEYLANALVACRDRLNNLQKYKRNIYIWALTVLVNTVILISIISSGFGGSYMVFLVLQCVLSVFLAKARDKSKVAGGVVAFITLGFFTPFSALKGLIEAVQASPKQLKEEQEHLNSDMQRMETEIQTTQRSLGVLNSKLSALKVEEDTYA
ncbi:MAG: TIR domain-containing protein [Ruminococcaceae bacterium]|nr:TIR domain-containing protein [Oscillospiraceae bacterium]